MFFTPCRGVSLSSPGLYITSAISWPGTKIRILWADFSAVNVRSMETCVSCKGGI